MSDVERERNCIEALWFQRGYLTLNVISVALDVGIVSPVFRFRSDYVAVTGINVDVANVIFITDCIIYCLFNVFTIIICGIMNF